jgi:hypothetical protein
MTRLLPALLFLSFLTFGRGEEKFITIPQGSDLGDATFLVRSTNRKDGTAEFTITISPKFGSFSTDPPPRARLGFLLWNHGPAITDARPLTPRAQDHSLIYTFTVNPGWLLDYTLRFVFTLPPTAASTEETSYHFPLLSYTEDGPDPRRSYESLRVYQHTPAYLFTDAGKDYQVDLNGDGRRERMVNFGWRAHQDNRSIFTLRHRKWHFIGYIDLGESLKLLHKTRAGWHDFYVDRELARSEVVREFYRWDTRSKLYEMHSSRQIHPAERAPE